MRLTKEMKRDIMHEILGDLFAVKIQKLEEAHITELTELVLNIPENKEGIKIFNTYSKKLPHLFTSTSSVRFCLVKSRKITAQVDGKPKKVSEDYQGVQTIKQAVADRIKTHRDFVTDSGENHGTYLSNNRSSYGSYSTTDFRVKFTKPVPIENHYMYSKDDKQAHKLMMEYERKLFKLADKICETIKLVNNILDCSTTRKKFLEMAPDLVKYAPYEPPKEIKLIPVESVQKVTRMLKNRAEGKD